jgi:hypothetical protein
VTHNAQRYDIILNYDAATAAASQSMQTETFAQRSRAVVPFLLCHESQKMQCVYKMDGVNSDWFVEEPARLVETIDPSRAKG